MDRSGSELVRSILHTHSTRYSICESLRASVAAKSSPPPPPPHRRLSRTSRGPQGQTARPFSPVFGMQTALAERDRSSSLRVERTSHHGDTGPPALCCSSHPLLVLYHFTQSNLSHVTNPPMVESWAPVTGHNDLCRISTSGTTYHWGSALTRTPYMVVIGQNPTFVIRHTSCRRFLQAVWRCHALQALSN